MSDSESDQAGVPLVERLSASASPERSTSAKRKRGDHDVKAETKRAAKRRKAKRPKDVEDEALDLEQGVNHAISHMDSRLLADHIAQRTKRFQAEMSLVELEDSYVPGMTTNG